MLWPKYCITKVNKECYDQSIVLQKKVNKVLYYKSKQRCMTKALYYKSKQRCMTKVLYYKVNKDVMTKVLYYKSKQRCYDQSIVLQK